MKVSTLEFDNKLDELLICLDCDAQYLRSCLTYLDELKKLVIKRDEAALRELLEIIQAELDNHKKHESARQIIRKELAEYLDCSVEQMTLTNLETGIIVGLAQNQRKRINDSKTKLKMLTEKLKVEYSSTVILLSECSRFNNLVLKSIFALGKTGAMYYNSSGAARRQNESAFVNLRL